MGMVVALAVEGEKMKLKIKHIYIDSDDWDKFISELSTIFKGSGPELAGFDGVLVTTDKHADLANMKILSVDPISTGVKKQKGKKVKR